MKIRKFILIMPILFSLIFLLNCNESKKGNWSESEKQKFRDKMESIKEFSQLSAYKTKFIECYLEKCEENYESFDEANKDKIGIDKIAKECINEVFSSESIKGKWSEFDKQFARKKLESLEELNNLGEYRSQWIECYLNKLEINYSSFYEANNNESENEVLASECGKEIFSNGSILGNWSDSDKQSLRNEINNVKELSKLGSKKEIFVECYIRKCEAIFSSYYEAANNQNELDKIAMECSEEIDF